MIRLTNEKRDQCRRGAQRVGMGGLILSAIGVAIWPTPFLRGYLAAYLFLFGIGIGSLVILMIQHLTGGRWGAAIRRLLESGSRTLPILAILFVPIILGLRSIYVWAVPASDHQPMGFQAHYLRYVWFVIRAVVYFACWSGIAYFLNRWSRRHDETGDDRWSDRMRTLSGPGLVICGLTLTFASVDWLMSLDPHWFSTIFSMVFAGGQALSAMAFAVLLLAFLSELPPLADIVTPKTRIDLGNMLLAFVMFWAYVSFSQFLLIWMGDLPEEIRWYLPRVDGGWKWITIALALLHFAVPFALLLSRDVKRDPRWLAGVAALVLVMRLVAVFWDVVPGREPTGLWQHWPEFVGFTVTLVGLGGIWLAAFLNELGKLPLVALNGPAAGEGAVDE